MDAALLRAASGRSVCAPADFGEIWHEKTKTYRLFA